MHPDSDAAPNQVVRLVADCEASLRKLVKDKLTAWEPRMRLAAEMGKAGFNLQVGENKMKEAPRRGTEECFSWLEAEEWITSKLTVRVMHKFGTGFTHRVFVWSSPSSEAAQQLQVAAKVCEDNDECVSLQNTVKKYLDEIQQKFKDACWKQFDKCMKDSHASREGHFNMAERYEEALRRRFPKDEMLEAMAKAKGAVHEKVKAAKAEAAARAAEEKRKRDEQNAKEASAWEEKFLAPFAAGGSVTVGGAQQWVFAKAESKLFDGKVGEYKLSNGPMVWTIRPQPKSIIIDEPSEGAVFAVALHATQSV